MNNKFKNNLRLREAFFKILMIIYIKGSSFKMIVYGGWGWKKFLNLFQSIKHGL